MVFAPYHLIMGVVLLLGGLGTLFWVWMLVDCLQNQALDQTARIRWAVGIAVTHVLGAAIYFFVRRGDRTRRESTV
jgi:uncharacterized membrane protein